MLDEPQLSVVAFRLRAERQQTPIASGPSCCSRVNARRRVFLSSTQDRTAATSLRLCVLSYRTHADRVRDAVEALREEARTLLG